MSDKVYLVGDHVWNQISRSKNAWRMGTITKSNGKTQYPSLTITSPHGKFEKEVWGYRSEYEIIPRMAVPNVPINTLYLVDTKMGEMLGQRLQDASCFSVFECSTKAMTKGSLLGYIVLPCGIWSAKDYHTLPGYKTWSVGPSVFELLSFLGEKLPEILSVNKQLREHNGKEATTTNGDIKTA